MEKAQPISIPKPKVQAVGSSDFMFFTLILLAFMTDLLTPYSIWKSAMPGAVRWISHASIAVMVAIVYARAMAFDRVPGSLWLILAMTGIGVVVAFMNGQGLFATLWGWWIMFQYPFVALFAYLQPSWPKKFSRWLHYVLVTSLILTVGLQTVQYFLGEAPGDNLSGLFGKSGTAKLVIFILLSLCFALGNWLAKGKWRLLLVVLVLGSISSILGSIKIFPFATVGLGIFSVILIILRGRRVVRLIPYTLLVLALIIAFFLVYNVVIPGAERLPLQSFLELETLDRYFGTFNQRSVSGDYFYNVGRNYALKQIWNEITQDNLTFLLGMGLGARGESQSLGIMGVGLKGSELGPSTGSSLLVIMQELGLLGLIVLAGFFGWSALLLFNGIRKDPTSSLTALRYGLLLFTVMWPIWLWYATVWSFRVPMLIYWVVLGYVMSHSDGKGKLMVQIPQS